MGGHLYSINILFDNIICINNWDVSPLIIDLMGWPSQISSFPKSRIQLIITHIPGTNMKWISIWRLSKTNNPTIIGFLLNPKIEWEILVSYNRIKIRFLYIVVSVKIIGAIRISETICSQSGTKNCSIISISTIISSISTKRPIPYNSIKQRTW